jgi:hypothetical protein
VADVSGSARASSLDYALIRTLLNGPVAVDDERGGDDMFTLSGETDLVFDGGPMYISLNLVRGKDQHRRYRIYVERDDL